MMITIGMIAVILVIVALIIAIVPELIIFFAVAGAVTLIAYFTHDKQVNEIPQLTQEEIEIRNKERIEYAQRVEVNKQRAERRYNTIYEQLQRKNLTGVERERLKKELKQVKEECELYGIF